MPETAAREYIPPLDPVEVETPFGTVDVHVNHMSDIHIAAIGTRVIVVDGVKHHVTMNLRRLRDTGTWVDFDEDQLGRTFAGRLNGGGASEVKLRRIREVLVPCIGKWAEENIGLRVDAHRIWLSNDVLEAESARDEAKKVYEEATETWLGARARESEFNFMYAGIHAKAGDDG